jgi:hypothetical protein
MVGRISMHAPTLMPAHAHMQAVDKEEMRTNDGDLLRAAPAHFSFTVGSSRPKMPLPPSEASSKPKLKVCVQLGSGFSIGFDPPAVPDLAPHPFLTSHSHASPSYLQPPREFGGHELQAGMSFSTSQNPKLQAARQGLINSTLQSKR